MLKRIMNQKGMTLTELIVAMLVMSIIMLAVTAVFLPIYNAYVNANELAEVNLLLNSLSAYIMSDLENARDEPALDTPYGTLTINTRIGVACAYATEDNVLTRNSVPVLDEGYYKKKGAAIKSLDVSDGICTVELALLDRNGAEIISRAYSAKPVGLQ